VPSLCATVTALQSHKSQNKEKKINLLCNKIFTVVKLLPVVPAAAVPAAAIPAAAAVPAAAVPATAVPAAAVPTATVPLLPSPLLPSHCCPRRRRPRRCRPHHRCPAGAVCAHRHPVVVARPSSSLCGCPCMAVFVLAVVVILAWLSLSSRGCLHQHVLFHGYLRRPVYARGVVSA
jgi:hypothetical protein